MPLTHEQESSNCIQSRLALGICSSITTTLVVFMLIFLKVLKSSQSEFKCGSRCTNPDRGTIFLNAMCHQDMAKPLPIVAQEDLVSFTLARIGSGFALKAFHISWNTHISVKLLTSQNTMEREWTLLLQDIANIRCCKSEHLLASLGIYHYQRLVGIVTEWMINGSLHSLIHEHQLYPDLPFPLPIRILSDVAEGLHYLHSLQPAVCHYSLKPSSVLLDAQDRAKETAINACKGSEVYTLQTGIQNSEVICQQKLSQVMSKKIPPVVPSLSPVLLGSSTNIAGRENILEAYLANPILQDSTKKDYPHSDRRKPFRTLPLSGPTAGGENCQRKEPPPTLKHSPQTMHPEQPVTGPCCKGDCSQILASQRGTILSCMTEGRLNHILDVLRSQQMLSRTDYETIISYPTVTSRARALLDICLCLGERAAQVVVAVLTVNKCSPLARVSCRTGCPETNRLLL